MPEVVRIHIAMNPSSPRYGIIVEYDDGRELWDWDCASMREEETLALAREAYPDWNVTMWDDPHHYSQRRRSE